MADRRLSLALALLGTQACAHGASAALPAIPLPPPGCNGLASWAQAIGATGPARVVESTTCAASVDCPDRMVRSVTALSQGFTWEHVEGYEVQSDTLRFPGRSMAEVWVGLRACLPQELELSRSALPTRARRWVPSADAGQERTAEVKVTDTSVTIEWLPGGSCAAKLDERGGAVTAIMECGA